VEIILSASLNQDINWNYRKIEQRLIVIKTKNEKVRKAATLDVLTNLFITINVPENISMIELQPKKEYLAQLKVYTSKNLDGIDKEFIDFFDSLDIDQAIEDFIKAYWIYPSKILFELSEIEEP
jgi:hypothetical protein